MLINDLILTARHISLPLQQRQLHARHLADQLRRGRRLQTLDRLIQRRDPLPGIRRQGTAPVILKGPAACERAQIAGGAPDAFAHGGAGSLHSRRLRVRVRGELGGGERELGQQGGTGVIKRGPSDVQGLGGGQGEMVEHIGSVWHDLREGLSLKVGEDGRGEDIPEKLEYAGGGLQLSDLDDEVGGRIHAEAVVALHGVGYFEEGVEEEEEAGLHAEGAAEDTVWGLRERGGPGEGVGGETGACVAQRGGEGVQGEDGGDVACEDGG